MNHKATKNDNIKVPIEVRHAKVVYQKLALFNPFIILCAYKNTLPSHVEKYLLKIIAEDKLKNSKKRLLKFFPISSPKVIWKFIFGILIEFFILEIFFSILFSVF